MCGYGTSPFYIYALGTSLGGYDFFNSIVVRLPFNLTSEGSERWLFYILVVILMWLCEETSHVLLPRRPDQKPLSVFTHSLLFKEYSFQAPPQTY